MKNKDFYSYLEINGNVQDELFSNFQLIDSNSTYQYPWDSLENDLKNNEKQKIGLFGYGSLINKESALRTVKPVDNLFLPAVGFGMKRLFDYDPPEEVKKRSMYKGTLESKNRGLYNVQFTGFLSDVINGVYFEITLDQIQAFREREIGYNLKKVLCIDWETKSKISVCYALGCERNIRDGKPITNEKIYPNMKYWEVCLDGASNISDEFADFLKQTSFLADGITTMDFWLKNDIRVNLDII